MTSSDEREEAAPGDGATTSGGDPKATKAGRKASKAAKKAARREAKIAAKAVAGAAKAAKREAKSSEQAARETASSASTSEAGAAKAAEAELKAQAKAVRREAKAPSAASRIVSPAVAHASDLLEEAAQLIRQGEEPIKVEIAEPDAESGLDAHPDAAEAAKAEPEPQPEPRAVELAPEPRAVETAADAAPELEPEADEPEPAAEVEPAAAELEPVEPEVVETAAEPDIEAETGPEPAAEVAPEAAPDGESATPVAKPAPGPAPRLEVDVFPELTAGATPAALLAPVAATSTISVPARAHVAAAIDVGATSVHLLVGTVDGHRVAPLLDESVFLGLGDRVGAMGYFGDDLRVALVADLVRYVTAARELGASSVTIVGTEPMRRAADAATVIHEVESRAGAPFLVLDHDEEGLITLVGATGGSPVTGQLLLVDIGGGSTEFVVVGPGGQPRTLGLPLGASRLTRELVRSDPPTLTEIEALRKEVAAIVADAPEASPSEIVAVGGTASNLLRLLPATAIDRSLTRRRIAVALAMLTVERSSEAATRHLIRPERARILPAGAIIVDAILERYGADRLRVSEAGIREGAILAVVHGGPAWRDRLASISRGWRDPDSRS